MKKIPIIMDCDPGHDDAIALVLAFAREELDVKAVTVVAGNSTLEKTLKNAKKIINFLGKQVPVAAGAAKPLVRELVTAPSVHGESGLEGPKIPEPSFSEEPIPAIELMRRIITESSEPVTLVPTGPLTNIASLFMIYPELKKNIRQISMMGGAIETSNWTVSAEFNVFVDPEAADIVFKSGIPITMSGLDVTHRAMIRPEEVEQLRRIGGKVSEMAADLIEFYSRFYISQGMPGTALHDPCAVAWLVKPELFTSKALHIDIETHGIHSTGMTIADRRPWTKATPNALVLFDVDRSAFIEMLFDACRSYGF